MTLTVAPGPDNTFVVAQGIARGRRAAIVTALGMCSGVSVHTLAAAVGLSALLYSSATAFTLLKFAGAAYLLWLGWRSLREDEIFLPQVSGGGESLRRLFFRGFLMNVVNPKVGLFFLAFLPQFVVPANGRPALQMLLLGLIFMLQAMALFSLIGYLSGGIGELVCRRPRLGRLFGRLTAGIFFFLGLRLALAER